MATRATYSFVEKDITFTYYIHHDGYLSGAAEYFDNSITASGTVSAENFNESNRYAELTENHAAHGDTEYRYTISDGGSHLVAYHYEFDTGEWDVLYEGPVEEFVMLQLEPS